MKGNYLDIRKALIGLKYLSTQTIPFRSLIFWREFSKTWEQTELQTELNSK